MAHRFKFTPFETSAYSGMNVESAFNCLVYKIFEPSLTSLHKIREAVDNDDLNKVHSIV